MQWPVTNPTYGTRDWLRRECGVYLDFGGDYAVWTHVENGIVDSCVDSGLKQFYFPPMAAEDEVRHEWSFLSPEATLETENGTQSYLLPEDFAGGVDEFTFGSNVRVLVISDAEMRAVIAKEGASNAAPKYAAIRPKTVNDGNHQRHEVVLYPTPDSTYTLTYQYHRNPPTLDETTPTPYGTDIHSETILESVLAIAESRYRRDESLHQTRFTERLKSSMMTDQRIKRVRSSEGRSWEITEPSFGTYDYFLRAVGRFMQFGWNPNAWSYDQDRLVNMLVQEGLKQFYFPPGAEGASEPYCWNFLLHKASLGLSASDYDMDLPADFGMKMQDLTYSVNGKQRRIELISEGDLRAKQAEDDQEGPPVYAAIRPKAVDYTAEQTWEVIFHPTPEKAYTVEYRYSVSPADATTSNEYPLGTRAHANTILASCLSCAELERDGQLGPQHQKFMERLNASMQRDMMLAS